MSHYLHFIDTLLEDFVSHPKLTLPTKGFNLDLSKDVLDPTLHAALRELQDLYGDGSSGRRAHTQTRLY